MRLLAASGGQVRTWMAAAFVTVGCTTTEAPDTPDAATPPGFELVLAEGFDDEGSLAHWTFSDPEAWTWHADGALELVGESDYAPPHRSPRSIALLDRPLAGDFVLEADLMQTGREYAHRDLCLFFAFEGAADFYYIHLATTPDPNAHNAFLVHDAPRRPLAPVAEEGVDWGSEVWHRVRLERLGSAIRVFFDGDEVIACEDATLGAGRIGVGSFDDQGRFDKLRVWAPPGEVPPTGPSPFAGP